MLETNYRSSWTACWETSRYRTPLPLSNYSGTGSCYRSKGSLSSLSSARKRVTVNGCRFARSDGVSKQPESVSGPRLGRECDRTPPAGRDRTAESVSVCPGARGERVTPRTPGCSPIERSIRSLTQPKTQALSIIYLEVIVG